METNQLEHYSVLECMGVNEKDSLRVNHETRTIELLVNTTCDKFIQLLEVATCPCRTCECFL